MKFARIHEHPRIISASTRSSTAKTLLEDPISSRRSHPGNGAWASAGAGHLRYRKRRSSIIFSLPRRWPRQRSSSMFSMRRIARWRQERILRLGGGSSIRWPTSCRSASLRRRSAFSRRSFRRNWDWVCPHLTSISAHSGVGPKRSISTSPSRRQDQATRNRRHASTRARRPHPAGSAAIWAPLRGVWNGAAHERSRSVLLALRGRMLSKTSPDWTPGYARESQLGALAASSMRTASASSSSRIAAISSRSCARDVALAIGAVTPGRRRPRQSGVRRLDAIRLRDLVERGQDAQPPGIEVLLHAASALAFGEVLLLAILAGEKPGGEREVRDDAQPSRMHRSWSSPSKLSRSYRLYCGCSVA